MIALGAYCGLLPVGLQPGFGLMAYGLAIVTAGSVWTTIRRLHGISSSLNMKGSK
jgi:hypothetical protein